MNLHIIVVLFSFTCLADNLAICNLDLLAGALLAVQRSSEIVFLAWLNYASSLRAKNWRWTMCASMSAAAALPVIYWLLYNWRKTMQF